MGKGAKQPSTQQVNTTTSNIPEYARPYYQQMMERANSALKQNYTPYEQERIAGFTPQQQAVQQDVAKMQTPGQFGTASTLGTAAGLGALDAAKYTPAQIQAAQVGAQKQVSPDMQAAQANYRPDLQYFQMQGPDTFGAAQAQQYMSPFMQAALEPQLREAMLNAKRGQLAEDLGAARQGSYGGSRQLLASMERERNLGQNLGDIEARGLQAAYENAQQQFNTEQGARQATRLQNLQAQLGVQGLGIETGTKMALANLDAESQARVQNLAAQLQTQGLNADQAMKAALANQQSDLDAQRLSEQSRQFGATQGLAGLAQANQAAQTMANIGQAQQNADISRYGLQSSTAAQQQALNQQYLDTAYQDYLRQLNYPMEQLQQYSGLLHGVPVTPNTTTTVSAPPPSLGAQLLGTGLGAAGLYKTFAGA